MKEALIIFFATLFFSYACDYFAVRWHGQSPSNEQACQRLFSEMKESPALFALGLGLANGCLDLGYLPKGPQTSQ